ncbi:glutamate receptor 2.7-like [Dorcoceras hygrometricum]|uniref:Glutamate receptor 2.7-like n=1 Tax=Dorcoceras hygrometricum TaxID=472368 RepID=A0A2Z7A5A4_9LAMI|nr:glutamate receptor 2.7-like [Dorcoceras hygrometricum]
MRKVSHLALEVNLHSVPLNYSPPNVICTLGYPALYDFQDSNSKVLEFDDLQFKYQNKAFDARIANIRSLLNSDGRMMKIEACKITKMGEKYAEFTAFFRANGGEELCGRGGQGNGHRGRVEEPQVSGSSSSSPRFTSQFSGAQPPQFPQSSQQQPQQLAQQSGFHRFRPRGHQFKNKQGSSSSGSVSLSSSSSPRATFCGQCGGRHPSTQCTGVQGVCNICG